MSGRGTIRRTAPERKRHKHAIPPVRRARRRAMRSLAAAVILAVAVVWVFVYNRKQSYTTAEESPAYTAEAAIEGGETTTHIIAPDWSDVLVRAIVEGNGQWAATAESERNREIQAGERDETELAYIDLMNLAKIMEREAGVDWPDFAIMAIGEVVLNRVDSPLFPNSISEVLHQKNPVQYQPVFSQGWDEFLPSERYVRLALRLMNGERVFGDETILYQALFPQGEETVMTYKDLALGSTTYFCVG